MSDLADSSSSSSRRTRTSDRARPSRRSTARTAIVSRHLSSPGSFSPPRTFLRSLSSSPGAIDLIPKFIIASGELTKILIHTDVLRYLEFRQIAGSFVYRDGRISKVPSTEMEALRSSLMGIFEKRRAKKFFEFLQNWKDDDPVTHQGESNERLIGRRSRPSLPRSLCSFHSLSCDADP